MDPAELIQNLEDVGYTGPMLDPTKLNQAVQDGAKSTEFTSLVSWITNQISSFGVIDETVQPTTAPEDANSFLMELSTFLKELGCTNKKLTTGNVNQRLATIEDKTVLLEFLLTELMATKILETKKPENDKSVQITISESITAKNMREMLTALRFQKPPDNISPDLLFKKLHTKVSEVISQVPKDLVGKPLFFGELSKDQWAKLDKLHGDLNDEYTIRREMLLKRLDVTVNSFSWSERIRPKEDELNKCYHAKRDAMKREPEVTLANLLSARDDLAIIEKTSNASVRKNTRSAINKVIIGSVPDRGGRPCDQEPPPPEMPSWQKDRVQGPQRGGFGGGGGGGRGRGGGERGGGRGGGQGGGGFRDNKSAATNFGQNFDKPQNQYSNYQNQNSSFGNQSGGYNNKPSYSNQNSGHSSTSSGYGSSYGNQSSGYTGNQSSSYVGSSGYSNQSNYGNQGSNYGNQGSGYNQGGNDRRTGGTDYNRGNSSRVQGGWSQGGDSNYNNRGGYNNRNQGGGGGRRY